MSLYPDASRAAERSSAAEYQARCEYGDRIDRAENDLLEDASLDRDEACQAIADHMEGNIDLKKLVQAVAEAKFSGRPTSLAVYNLIGAAFDQALNRAATAVIEKEDRYA